MDIMDRYVFSINFDSTQNYDRERSPYFCQNQTPCAQDQNNSIINNNSFEFSHGFNPGLTLDKYFGGNFKAIQLQDMEVDETFDIYTRGRKLQARNKSYHYKNDSKFNLVSSPNEMSMELIKETQETPLKENLSQMNQKKSFVTKNEKNDRINSFHTLNKEQISNLYLKNGNKQNAKQKAKSFKRSFIYNNKSLSPFNKKEEEKTQKENIEKNNKLDYKEKEMLKSYQLAQILKKQNPENHIVMRKISHSLHKKPAGYLPSNNHNHKNTFCDPLSDFQDLGLAKDLQKLKQPKQIERKNKIFLEKKDSSEKIAIEQPNLEQMGKTTVFSRKELTKRFAKKKKEN